METDCILCGKGVGPFPYTSKIEGFSLYPLCPDCHALCLRDPKKILADHRALFETMLAERRESLLGRPAPTDVASSGARPQRSQHEQVLVRRYDDAYRVANSIVRNGKALKAIGVVLAVLILLGTI